MSLWSTWTCIFELFPERLEKELQGLLPPSISNGIRVVSPSYGADSAWVGAKLIGNVSYFITKYLNYAKPDMFAAVMFSFCASWSDHFCTTSGLLVFSQIWLSFMIMINYSPFFLYSWAPFLGPGVWRKNNLNRSPDLPLHGKTGLYRSGSSRGPCCHL